MIVVTTAHTVVIQEPKLMNPKPLGRARCVRIGIQQFGLFYVPRSRTPDDTKAETRARGTDRGHGKASARCNSVTIRGARRNATPGDLRNQAWCSRKGVILPSYLSWGRGKPSGDFNESRAKE